MSSKRVAVAKVDDVPEGEARVYEVAGEHVALCKVNGEVFAIEDRCTHDDGPLGEGCLYGYEIECPRHGARFDVRDGRVLSMPAAHPVRSFAVEVENGQVFVEIAAEFAEE